MHSFATLCRLILAILVCAVSLVMRSDAEEEPLKALEIQRIDAERLIILTGRVKSRHVGWRKGHSVREYYLVSPGLEKVMLPRSHVEHRDGTISGIELKSLRGKIVQLTCEGKVKRDPKKGIFVSVEKVNKAIVCKSSAKVLSAE